MHSNDDAVAVKATTAGMDTEDVTLRDALLSTKKSCLKVRSTLQTLQSCLKVLLPPLLLVNRCW